MRFANIMFALLVSSPALAGAALSPARQAELMNILKQDCGSCHGLTLKGGLGPALRPDDLAGKPDALLLKTILDGRPGTPMPPWRPILTEEEAAWMVRVLKRGDAL